MADDVDITNDRINFDVQVDIINICEQAKKFDTGSAGDCDLCGETYSRLVTTTKDDELVRACGKCRDKHGLK